MAAPREHVTTEIVALGTPEVPYVFTATPAGVTGTWDYADARWAGLMAAGTVDRTYRLVVELHDDGTYSLTDHGSASEARVGSTGGGGFGASYSSTRFRGTVRSKSFNRSYSPIASDHGQVGHTYGWRFDSDEMKDPVEAVLERNGWTARRRGLWARLTGQG